MEQLDIPSGLQLPINYQSSDVSGLVRYLRPVLFRKGGGYCCLLGPNTESGILGCGSSPQKAITDWERKIADLLLNAPEADQLVTFIKNALKTST